MPDDRHTPAPIGPRRPRRFVVRNHDDDRASEKIEEFLAGPRTRLRSRRQPAAEPTRVVDQNLDTRTDFVAALRSESARTERYQRPATVIGVEFALGEPAPTPHQQVRQIDRLAGPIGFTLRREGRDTDRIARVASNRFHVLLPETSEEDALGYIERARQACEVWFAGAALPVDLKFEAESTTGDLSLTQALAAVEERLSA
jgi:hypothetical protein